MDNKIISNHTLEDSSQTLPNKEEIKKDENISPTILKKPKNLVKGMTTIIKENVFNKKRNTVQYTTGTPIVSLESNNYISKSPKNKKTVCCIYLDIKKSIKIKSMIF